MSWSGSVPARIARGLERDAALEAQRLAAAFIAADARLTDAERTAYVRAFAPWFPGLAVGARSELRDSDIMQHRNAELVPSPLLADPRRRRRERHTGNGWRYYDAALAIGHAVCALDDLPGRARSCWPSTASGPCCSTGSTGHDPFRRGRRRRIRAATAESPRRSCRSRRLWSRSSSSSTR